MLNDTTDELRPAGSGGVPNDNVVSLGASTKRFKDLHLSGTANVGTIASTGSMTLDVGANLTIDVDGTTIVLNDGGLNWGQMFSTGSGAFNIYSPQSNQDIVFRGNDGGTNIIALTLDMSVGGQLKAAPLGVSTPTYAFSNDSNTGMTRPTSDTLQFVTAGQERVRITDAGNVGIGTDSPSGNLEIATSASDTGVDLVLDGNRTSNGGIGSIIFNNNGDSVGMIRSHRASANDAAHMLFYTQATGGGNTERARIDSSGNFGIGETNVDAKLHLTTATAWSNKPKI